MLNWIWCGLILVSLLVAGTQDIAGLAHLPAGANAKPEDCFPHLAAVTTAAFDSAKVAVNLAIGLIGIMALWLGLMRLAEKGGLVQLIAAALRPLLRRLFPDVPRDHPALGAMVMNMSANLFGLANAATPLGLKAMEELDKLNPHKGTATNAMCTFLAINNSSITLIPATVIGILAGAGSRNPQTIILTTLIATTVSAVTAVTAAKILEKLPCFRPPPEGPVPAQQPPGEAAP